MITFENKYGPLRIVEDISELPDFAGAVDIYADAETTSFDDTTPAFHPHLGHRVCGWAITVDNAPGAWYIPIRHRSPGANNLDPVVVSLWFQEILDRGVRWINHNVKFDAHFAAADNIAFGDTELWCTVVLAKTIDSDRYSHALKPLLREWLELDTPEETEVKSYLDSIQVGKSKATKCKDYGRVPIDTLGRYACMDVIGNRKLMRYLEANRPEGMEGLWRTETLLTPVLFDMEAAGLFVDEQSTMHERLKAMSALVTLGEAFETITGRELVDSNKLYHEILVGQLGLPVLSWGKPTKTRGRSPSFDKAALELYAGHPRVLSDPEGAGKLVKIIRTFRSWQTYNGLFLEPFLERRDAKGLLHSNYNQVVRTGRMSCSDPNAQQFDARAGRLIIPEEGRTFLCGDASQMEFRLIVHYTKDEDAIIAYANDPNTDYHQWVADLCEVARKPAKNLNFAMAYGAGKGKVTHMLQHNKSIMEEVGATVDAAIARGDVLPGARASVYGAACENKAEEIYRIYHERLPGIRTVSEKASALCKRRGWIRNAYGRRRHLPAKAAYRAFNSLVQGCAMDAIKHGMVTLAPRYNRTSRDMGLRLLANKHDEVLADLPIEAMGSPEVEKHYLECMQNVGYDFRVPIVWDAGWSRDNWTDAKP